MLRYCLTLFLTLFAALSASAQRTLNGKITSADGKPLAGAIIQVYDGDKNVAFGNSRQDGSYKLAIPEAHAKRKLTVNVRKLNYANRILDLPTGQTTLDAVLSPGEESLREVIVKAPAVEQSGDTLRFFMGQFATGTDVSLEDGLKRIPGIKVSESGAISYMGRDISQFYIEGLNLLGGRYTLATRNIPVDKVTGVEVLRHHQPNKVDKDELTADVALNIRLSEKAKIKPFGTYELRAGLEDGKRPLYAASGTAMLFRKTFQLLTTLKLGNEGRMGVDETREHEPATDIYYSILEVGGGIYKYGMLSTYGGAEKYLPAELEELRKEDCLRDEYLWVTQNYPEEGTMTVEDALHPAIFVYTEPMDSMCWDLMPGDTTILDYPCHKAQARYAGREWAVWYTEEIPVPSGPWKFAGLPGLVLLAQDKTGTHAFQATSVFNVDSQPIHRVSSQWYTMKDTKRDEFIKTRNKIKCDSRWLKMPYYNDEANMYMAVLRADVRKRLGIRPFISFNMIKYPCREDEGGGLEYIYNAFQPLELY